MAQSLQLKLNQKKFELVDPSVRFGSMNAMALVSKLQKERPTSVIIDFDGKTESRQFLDEIAADAGYVAGVEGTRATLEPS